ncbi:MAG: hypothetical protein HZA82_04675, partial [Thaumarchaeota archaeon]|nr:hypothetical protein [Nitrososphaerota archaeon]
MSQVETRYDQFLSELQSVLQNIDVSLAMRIMYLERKFPDVDPCVDLSIKFKKGVDLEKKEFQINAKFGLATSSRDEHVYASGQLDMENLLLLSSGSDIEKIT